MNIKESENGNYRNNYGNSYGDNDSYAMPSNQQNYRRDDSYDPYGSYNYD